MIVDLPSSSATELAELSPAATIVVGAGAAGIALALALEESGRPVVLVESGGDPRDRAAMDSAGDLNEGTVTGQTYYGLQGARARVLGGATQLWHGQCTRLHPSDVDARDWLPHSGWPLQLADLEPWYGDAERFFGLSGRGYGRQRWAEHPVVTPLPWSAGALEDDFSEYTPTPYLGSRYRGRLESSALVTVLQNATVARVVTDGDRVAGVELRARDGRVEVLAGADVVLTAGAVENARILMLSDPAGVGLGAGRELTGRYLQDHPVIDTLDIEPVDPAWLQDRTSHLHRGRRRIWPKVRLAPALQERERLVDANAVLVHDYDDGPFDAARRVAGALAARRMPDRPVADGLRAVGALRQLVRTAYRRYVRGLSSGRPASRVRLQVWLEQVPDPESRVQLGTEKDPLGLPVAHIDWRIAETEIRTSRVFSEHVAADLERAGIAAVRRLPAMTDDAAWRASVVDANHPAGTTRMSADPSTGVVDPDLQVHGITGLHVAGSSVFPIAGYANPTLTIVALALRLADHLVRKQDLARTTA